MAVKKWVFFSKKYSEVAFLCNGTDRHEIPANKHQSVWCSIEPQSKNFKNFLSRGWFCPKQPFFGSFWPVSVHAYRSRVTFLDFANFFRLLEERQRCSHPNRLFSATNLLGGRSPPPNLPVAKFTQANDNDNILVLDLQDGYAVYVFGSMLFMHSVLQPNV